MNPKDISSARKLFSSIKTKATRLKRARAVLCVPYLYIESLSRLKNIKIELGAQDAYHESEGAFTGRISTNMLKKAGVKYVILGHSEMRATGDTNKEVNKKIKKALEDRLMVVLCVGEIVRDEEGAYLSFISDELQESLMKVPKEFFKNVIVAYEPIWAVGAKSKNVDTPADFLEKAIFIRKILSHITEKHIAMKIPILYGGSVNENNCEGFLRDGKADGLLIGRASLDKDSFGAILKIADSI